MLNILPVVEHAELCCKPTNIVGVVEADEDQQQPQGSSHQFVEAFGSHFDSIVTNLSNKNDKI